MTKIKWGYYLSNAIEFKKCNDLQERNKILNDFILKYGNDLSKIVVTTENPRGDKVVAVFDINIKNKIIKKEIKTDIEIRNDNIEKNKENIQIYNLDEVYTPKDFENFFEEREAKQKEKNIIMRIIEKIKNLFKRKNKNQLLLPGSNEKILIKDKITSKQPGTIVFTKNSNNKNSIIENAQVIDVKEEKLEKDTKDIIKEIKEKINQKIDTDTLGEWTVIDDKKEKMLYEGPTEEEIKIKEEEEAKKFVPNLDDIFGQKF